MNIDETCINKYAYYSDDSGWGWVGKIHKVTKKNIVIGNNHRKHSEVVIIGTEEECKKASGKFDSARGEWNRRTRDARIWYQNRCLELRAEFNPSRES